MTQLDQLRAFDADRISTDEGISLALYARQLKEEYGIQKFPIPDWLTEKSRAISRWLETHRRDILERKLTEARALKTTLMTPTERRAQLEADIAKLEQELGVAPAPAPAATAETA